MKLVAIVGMAGSGKSEAARIFEDNGFAKVRFGDVTDREISKRGLEINEENERYIREQLRVEYGMAAYARLSMPEVYRLLKMKDVIIDGLYSWEEYILVKRQYGEALTVVAVWSSPETRYKRLAKRKVRPLTFEEAASRDVSEIEGINKGGPIAMANFIIINEYSIEALGRETKKIIAALK